MRIFLLILIIIFTYGCSTLIHFKKLSLRIDRIAEEAGFRKEYINIEGFNLLTYQKFKGFSKHLRIYIEGDGRAWETKTKLSKDPTPLNPIALRLAIIDSFDNIAYIARPGQFSSLDSKPCDPVYWSTRRFSPEVINAFNKIIDILKEKSKAESVELVGYSGGAAIAVLVAAQRRDVLSIRTVAGNLNTEEFCNYHKVSKLEGSINPLEVAEKIASIPQRHFVGSKDKVIPFTIVESFVKKYKDKNCQSISIIEGLTHNKGWQKHWKRLLSMQLVVPKQQSK